jgi:nitroreductase
MAGKKLVPLTTYREYSEDEMQVRAREFYEEMKRRRTVRDFSSRPVPREIIEQCLLTAGTAPNGANMQPWRFVAVSDPEIKRQIRVRAEEVERDFYHRRAPKYWLEALAPLGTDEHKPYLEEAPYLIVIFSLRHTVLPDGTIKKHYYIAESVGIATGMLIAALHRAGLACLTHTPSPMTFLRDVLGRPKEETPYLILVTGYPKEGAQVPEITKKGLGEIAVFK